MLREEVAAAQWCASTIGMLFHSEKEHSHRLVRVRRQSHRDLLLLSTLEKTKVMCVFMNTQMPFPPLKARQLFAKVIVLCFIRPMSCVLEATAGRLLTAPGCPSKEQRVNHGDTKNKMLPLLSSASPMRVNQQPRVNLEDIVIKPAHKVYYSINNIDA